MKNPKVSVSLIAILIVLAVVFSVSTEDTPEQHGLSGVFQVLKNKVAGQNPSLTSLKKTSQTSVPTPSTAVDPQRPAEKFEQFKDFLQTEAKLLDHPKVNTDTKQTTLIERARQLDDAEKNYLKMATLNTNQPINERILSVYLLSLTTDSLSHNLINQIAQSPLPDHGPSTPHSESELRNTQELALRYMAIDKLVQNYKSNPPASAQATQAMHDLKAHSSENPIPQVRKYATDELIKISRKK